VIELPRRASFMSNQLACGATNNPEPGNERRRLRAALRTNDPLRTPRPPRQGEGRDIARLSFDAARAEALLLSPGMKNPLTFAPVFTLTAATSLVAPAAHAEPPLAPAPMLAPAPPAPISRYRSETMRTTGIVLTSVAIATLVGGGAWGLTVLGSENGAGFLGGVMIMMPLSAVIAAVGVPLWVVGAKPPESSAIRVPAWAMPRVVAGPRQALVRWTF
jgi:hypothetical protein